MTKKKNHLHHSVSTGFFGVLLILSLALNVYAFKKYDMLNGFAGKETSEFDAAEDGKIVKDGKVWLQLQDPIFDAYILSDKNCSVCVDLTAAKGEVSQLFPTANVKEIDVSSETGKELLASGVTVLPAVVLGKAFANIAGIDQLVTSGAVAPVLESGYYEFRTNGNKKILSADQLPAIPEGMTQVAVIGYTDFFSPDSAAFSTVMPQIAAQYGNTVAVQNRTFVADIPSAYIAEALVCGVEQEDIQEAQEEYMEAINETLVGVEEVNEEILTQISDELAKILQLRGDEKECYEKGEFAAAAAAAAAEAQSLGITGSPAYFVGNRFLAGNQSAEVFAAAIEEVLAERGMMPTEGEAPAEEMPMEEVGMPEGEMPIEVPAVSPEVPAEEAPETTPEA